MLLLGAWLVVVGLCDLLRAVRDVTSTGRRLLVLAVSLSLQMAVLFGLGVNRAGLVFGAVAALGSVAWVLGSAAALVSDRPLRRAVALGGLAVGLVALVVGGAGAAATEVAWPGSFGGPLTRLPPDAVALALGVALVQLASANIVVRLVLDAVGVPAGDNEKQLKGGRVLGPMERLFVLGLAAAGFVTAAGVVVAAKGLLRFPELQRQEQEGGPSDITEYFLIGSFASWLLALSGAGLLWIGLQWSGG